MNIRVKAISLAMLAAAVGGVIYLFHGYRADNIDQMDDSNSTTPTTVSSENYIPLDQYARVALKNREQNYDDHSREIKIPLAELKDADTRLIALSGSEAAWLDKHHYPTQAEIDASKNKTSAELKDSALLSKNPKELALYGGRLADEGNNAGAIAVYNQAAASGSIYALEESALLQYSTAKDRLGNSEDNKNILAANLEVAKILGDHRASALLAMSLEGYDVTKNSETVRLQTSEFLRQLGSAAQSSNKAASGPDPRPNADIWSDIDRATSNNGLISIYAR